MDFGKLLRRTWDIIWEHKFLIVLGILVALGSGGMNTSAGGGGTGFDFDQQGQNFVFPTPPAGGEMPELPELPDLGRVAWPMANIGLIIVLGGLALLLGLAVWVVSTIARGGLIAGASAIDAGGTSSFSAAWQAGWQKGWRLLGISILPAIPGLLLALAGLFSLAVSAGAGGLFGTEAGIGTLAGMGWLLTSITCLVLPIMMVLGLLQAFANRACMLEDKGVFAAYGRGLNVLFENFGQALLLFIIQVAINIGIGLVMILLTIALVLCCLWPVLIVIQGAIAAYFSTLWTLAWREWTGETPVVEAAI